MTSNKSILIEKTKKIIVEVIYNLEERLETNLSAYLSSKLYHDYTYLANIFSHHEGISIQAFTISHKIERVKKLMINDKLKLTEIASKLHYSSVAHLSNQFKRVTGLTPSSYKHINNKRGFTLEEV